MDLKSIKSEYKRLKKKVKSSPGLFTRVAAIELELGKLKSAKSRLEEGLKSYPDSMIAHCLLAECFSQTGDHESSLKHWEDVIANEPFNQEARSGYVRELAFLERNDAMQNALTELYLIDPYNIEISDRHKDTLLKDIREKHPDQRIWDNDWHPGDFTSIGAIARSISYERGYVPTRATLPDGFEPQIDETILNKITVNLPINGLPTDLEEGIIEALEDSPDADDIIEELDVDDAEAKALEALLDSDDEEDIDVDNFFTEKKKHDKEVLRSVEEQTGVVSEETLDEGTDILETGDSVEHPEEEVVDDTQEEEPELTIVEHKKELPKENKLKNALINCGVKVENIIDIESLAEQIFQEEFVLVEKPAIKQIEEAEEKHEVTQSDLDSLLTEKPEKVEEEEIDNGMDEIPPDLKEPLSQDDLDAILGTPDTSVPKEQPVAVSSGPLSQDELNALVEANKKQKQEEKAKPDKKPEGPLSQDDLDKLVAANNRATEPQTEEKPVSGGSLNQSELDALVAASKTEKQPEPAPEAPSGPLSQDDLDKLVAANNRTVEPQTEEKPVSGGSLNQSELDALVAASKTEKQPEPSSEAPSGPLSQDDLDKLVAANNRTVEPQTEEKPVSGGSLNQSELDALVAASKTEKTPEPEELEDEMQPDSISELDDLEGPLDQGMLDNLISEHSQSSDGSQDNRRQISKVAEKLREKLKKSGIDDLNDVPVVSDEQDIEIDQEVIDSITGSKNPFEDNVTQEDLTAAIDENLQSFVTKDGEEDKDISNQSELDSLIQKMKSGEVDDLDMSSSSKVKVGTLSLDELQSHLGEKEGISFTIETRDEGEEVSTFKKVTEKAEKYSDQEEVDALVTETETPEKTSEEELGKDVPSKDVSEVPKSGKPAFTDLPTPETIKRVKKTPPKREDETKPTEIKGPVSKTFVRLCMAQGKFKHAEEILRRLEVKTPDDPDLVKMREEITAKL